jgi:hypothetical protein
MGRRSNPFVTTTLGVLIGLFGLGWSAKTAWFVVTSEPLMGEVTSVYECTIRSRRRSRTAQCAQVHWKTPVGYVGSLELKPSRGFLVGSEVPLLYDPDNQGDVRQDTFNALWLFPSICLGMGGLFTVVGAVGILRRRAEGL